MLAKYARELISSYLLDTGTPTAACVPHGLVGSCVRPRLSLAARSRCKLIGPWMMSEGRKKVGLQEKDRSRIRPICHRSSRTRRTMVASLRSLGGCHDAVCFVRSKEQNMGQWTNHLLTLLSQYLLCDVGGDTRRSD